MRVHRGSSKSALFLIELIIAIVFFSVSAAICARLFVTAHQLSTRSGDLSTAATLGQTVADSFKADSAAYLAGGQRLELFYDRQGESTGSDGAFYRLVGELRDENGLHTAAISVYRTGGAEALFSLQVKSYSTSTAGSAEPGEQP